MSAPPVTIGGDASLAAAGRLMRRRAVSRLLVLDAKRRLSGVVTRGDLLKVHSRPDTVIRDEVQRTLRGTLMIEPVALHAAVVDGVVTLTGRTDRRTTALAAVGLAEAVPGVVEVVDQLAFQTDDTEPAAVPAPVHDPMRDWWTAAAFTAPQRVHVADDRQRRGVARYRQTAMPAGR